MAEFIDNNVTIIINGNEIDRDVFISLEPDYNQPDGVLTYQQGERFTINKDGNQTGHNETWLEGDTYISKVQAYLDRMAEIETDAAAELDFTDNINMVSDFETPMQSVDVSNILAGTYHGLTLKAHYAPDNNRIIGVFVADMRGVGALATVDLLQVDCDTHGVPIFGHLSPYNGTSIATLLTAVTGKGFTSLGEIAENRTYVYWLPDQSLDAAKKRALDAVKREHARQLDTFTGNATQEERDTWPIQLASAQRYLADSNAVDEAYLSGFLTSLEIDAGVTVADFANKIISKSELTNVLIQKAAQMKRESEQLIEAAQTDAQLTQILSDLKAQEAQAIADFQAIIAASQT